MSVALLAARGDVPQLDGTVVASRGQRLAVGREGQARDGVAVPLETADHPAGSHIPQQDHRVVAGRSQGRAVRRVRQGEHHSAATTTTWRLGTFALLRSSGARQRPAGSSWAPAGPRRWRCSGAIGRLFFGFAETSRGRPNGSTTKANTRRKQAAGRDSRAWTVRRGSRIRIRRRRISIAIRKVPAPATRWARARRTARQSPGTPRRSRAARSCRRPGPHRRRRTPAARR